MALALTRADDLGALILGAFRPTDSVTGRLSLAVVRHDDVALPQLEWARPWVEGNTEIPSSLAYPYRIFLDRIVGVVYVLDQRTGQAAVWIRHDSELDLRSFFTPFRVMLSWLASLVDAEIVHASAAVVDGRGIAFTGASGSGKSTLALALGFGGHPVIADDCILVEAGQLHAVFARAKLDAHSQSLLRVADAQLRFLSDTPGAKRLLALEASSIAFSPSAQLSGWAMPVLATRPGCYSLSPRSGHRMLAAHSLHEIHGGGARNRLRLARLSAQYPSFRIMVTPAMDENLDTVRRLAGSINGTQGAWTHGL